MEFYGRYEYSVDKGRVLLPPELRNLHSLYALIVNPKNLDFPFLVEFFHLEPYRFAVLFENIPDCPSDIEWYLKQNIRIIRPDKQNRILVPELELGEKAYVLGLGDRAEIWPKYIWEQKIRINLKHF